MASVLAAIATISGWRYQKEDWRSAIRQVRHMARPTDELFVANPEDVPVSHYYLEDALPIHVGLPDRSVDGRPWFLYRVPIESNHLLGEPADFDVAAVADPQVRDWLSHHSDQVARRWDYSGLALFLLEADSR